MGPMKPIDERIAEFLSGSVFAVAGASSRRHKYGNMVLRCYLENGRRAFAINPLEDVIEGQPAFKRLADLPERVHGLSIITPPAVTLQLVEDAAKLGIHRLWMQPGAESREALKLADELGLDVIAGGPCLLVVLGFRG